MTLKHSNLLIILLIGVITLISCQLPQGLMAVYPFTILATWFHEMGHGIAAIILGGSFHKLEIFMNGSGVASYSGDLMFGNVGNALVAAAGLIGPAFAGTILILMSLKPKQTKIITLILSIVMLLSVIIWIRNLFGIVFISIFGLCLFVLSRQNGGRFQSLTIQFLGVQAFASIFLNIGYFFSAGGNLGGEQYKSDSAVISESLFLPYWFWGGAIIAITLACIVFTLLIVHKSDLHEKNPKSIK